MPAERIFSGNDTFFESLELYALMSAHRDSVMLDDVPEPVVIEADEDPTNIFGEWSVYYRRPRGFLAFTVEIDFEGRSVNGINSVEIGLYDQLDIAGIETEAKIVRAARVVRIFEGRAYRYSEYLQVADEQTIPFVPMEDTGWKRSALPAVERAQMSEQIARQKAGHVPIAVPAYFVDSVCDSIPFVRPECIDTEVLL